MVFDDKRLITDGNTFITGAQRFSTSFFRRGLAELFLNKSLKMPKRITLIIALFAFIQTGFAQEDTLEASLLREVPEWMAAYHVPCVGVGLIENGRVKWVKNFGILQQGRPAPEHTLFNIASQTKPVTAMLVLRLVQAGKWDLDEPLAHYWIDPDIANDPYLGKLTTRIVLSHQTGFPNWRSDNGGTRLHFNFEPGTKFGYSGEGYEYLRKALEAKFRQPLNVLLDSWLLKPLGIGETQYWSERLDTSRFAMWHDGQGNRYQTAIQTPVNAADDLITSIEDYCNLGIYAMKNASLYNKPEVKIKENYYRGLGWGLVQGLPNGEYAFEHGGSDIGVRTMAVFLPNSKSGVVVMTNADNGMFISDRIIKKALPAGSQILATMNKAASVHERVVIDDQLIQRYTGSYEQSNGKIMKVEKEGNALKISGDGLPTSVIFPESKNKFFLEGYDVQLEFPDSLSLVVYEGGRQIMKIKRK
jgi:CubicO group peptidase (beta-lactamase class C family)